MTLEQIRRHGLTDRFIRLRVESGEWIQLAGRTVAVAGAPATDLQGCMAAVLSRSRALISGRTAAWLLDIGDTPRQHRPEITVPYSASGRSRIAIVRRSQHFGAIRTVNVDGITCAAATETVFRMSEYVSQRRLASMLDSLILANPESVEQLGDIYLRHGGERMRGMAKLRPLLLERLDDAWVPNESALETLADEVLGGLALPSMVRQAPLPWAPTAGRVDRLIPQWRLIVELDGRTWHARTEAFESDRDRDNAALRHGYSTVRLTWHMLKERPQYCRSLIRDIGRVTS